MISTLQYQLGPEGEAGGGRLCFLDRTEFVLLTVYKPAPSAVSPISLLSGCGSCYPFPVWMTGTHGKGGKEGSDFG